MSRRTSEAPQTPEERGEHVYDLFRRGSELLEAGDFAAAADPARARRARWSPTRPRSARRSAAPTSAPAATRRRAAEFAAVVERAPVNDFAHFCLGRALEKIGRRDEARHHAVLAAGLRPDRADYRAFRDRLQARVPVALGRVRAVVQRVSVPR